jgi:23S rRNA (pseudouridine1915-N3)-methyltransferase
MRVRVIAVGTRMPAWVRAACDDYLRRLKGGLPVALTELEPAARPAGGDLRSAIAAEGRRMLGALLPGDHVVTLDERARELSTRELAVWLSVRMQQGEDLAFVIGGPDGLAPEVLARGNFSLSLSRLTLPHALVRVLLAEQLYRAHCILTHHPYHRD